MTSVQGNVGLPVQVAKTLKRGVHLKKQFPDPGQ